MSEPSKPDVPSTPDVPSKSAARSKPGAPSRPTAPSRATAPSRYVDFFLYASAAVTYITLSIYNKWLLDWIIGPLWLVAWVWGLPALVKLVRRQPVRPRRNPIEVPESR